MMGTSLRKMHTSGFARLTSRARGYLFRSKTGASELLLLELRSALYAVLAVAFLLSAIVAEAADLPRGTGDLALGLAQK